MYSLESPDALIGAIIVLILIPLIPYTPYTGVPRMCFFNKMDRTGANFYKCLEMVKTQLETIPLVLQLPIGEEEELPREPHSPPPLYTGGTLRIGSITYVCRNVQ